MIDFAEMFEMEPPQIEPKPKDPVEEGHNQAVHNQVKEEQGSSFVVGINEMGHKKDWKKMKESRLSHLSEAIQTDSTLGSDSAKRSTFVEEFETRLNATSSLDISLKKKLSTERPALGKQGYLVEIDHEALGLLMFNGQNKCCSTPSTAKMENDPIDYSILSTFGEEILRISGLDPAELTENVVTVTFVPTRTKVGRILFDYFGSDPEKDTIISDAPTNTSFPTRTKKDPLYSEFRVPMSMLDAKGDMLYIFRRPPHDETYVEILTADGSAMLVTEVIVKQQGHRDSSKNKERKAHSLTVNFMDYVSSTNRILMLGMAVVMFNQWSARHPDSGRSRCSCIIC